MAKTPRRALQDYKERKFEEAMAKVPNKVTVEERESILREAVKEFEKGIRKPPPGMPQSAAYSSTYSSTTVTTAASPTTPSTPVDPQLGKGVIETYLVPCSECGAAIFKDMVVEHDEFHENIVKAIREQVEEVLDARKALPESTHVDENGNVIVKHSDVDWGRSG